MPSYFELSFGNRMLSYNVIDNYFVNIENKNKTIKQKTKIKQVIKEEVDKPQQQAGIEKIEMLFGFKFDSKILKIKLLKIL